MPDLLTAKPDDVLGAPMVPPRPWFDSFDGLTMPDGEAWDPINKDHPLIWVGTEGDAVGRIAVLVAPDDACILDGRERRGRCLKPPVEPEAYDYANISDTPTTDGDVRTGRLAGGLPHAGDGGMTMAQDHYANTGSGLARVRYVHDSTRGGTFGLGALDPDVTVWDALMLRASAVSGDWRWVEELGAMRLAASQVVNAPGFRPVVDRSPTRASLTYMLAAMGDEGYRSSWVLTAATARTSPSNPEFEAKHDRADDGTFASKPGSGSRKPVTEVLRDARAARKLKPGGGSGGGKSSKGKSSKGKGGKSPAQRAKDDAAKKAARDAASAAKKRADAVAKATRIAETGAAIGLTGLAKETLDEGLSEAARLISEGKDSEIAPKMTKTHARLDAEIARLEKSKDAADQEAAAKARNVLKAIADQVVAYGGARPVSKVDAANRAADVAKREADAAKKAADAAAKLARSQTIKPSGQKAAMHKEVTAMPCKNNCDNCRQVTAASVVVDAPFSPFRHGQEVSDVDGNLYYVVDDTVAMDASGAEVIEVVGSVEEFDSYPRLLHVLPIESLAATGRIVQWQPDEPVAAALGTDGDDGPVTASVEATDVVDGSAVEDAPTDAGVTRAEFDALLARYEILEGIVATWEAERISAVDLADAADVD